MEAQPSTKRRSAIKINRCHPILHQANRYLNGDFPSMETNCLEGNIRSLLKILAHETITV